MENRPYTLIAGLFAIMLGIGLMFSFWWLGNAHIPQAHYRMLSQSPVYGLNEQAAVRFRGVNVGHVERISLNLENPLTVAVDIAVDKRLQLTSGTYGHIAGQGLTGLSYIELDDNGTDKTPLNGQAIMLSESQMSSILSSGKNIVAQLNDIVANADRLLKSLNMVLDDKGRQRVINLLESLDSVSTELKPLLKATTATMEAARPSFAKLNDTLDTIGNIGTTVNEETLPRLHQLTHQLNRDAVNLNRLLTTLDEHPESVIFGKPAPPPGPAEAGFKQ